MKEGIKIRSGLAIIKIIALFFMFSINRENEKCFNRLFNELIENPSSRTTYNYPDDFKGIHKI